MNLYNLIQVQQNNRKVTHYSAGDSIEESTTQAFSELTAETTPDANDYTVHDDYMAPKDGRFYVILLCSFALIVLAICDYFFRHAR